MRFVAFISVRLEAPRLTSRFSSAFPAFCTLTFRSPKRPSSDAAGKSSALAPRATREATSVSTMTTFRSSRHLRDGRPVRPAQPARRRPLALPRGPERPRAAAATEHSRSTRTASAATTQACSSRRRRPSADSELFTIPVRSAKERTDDRGAGLVAAGAVRGSSTNRGQKLHRYVRTGNRWRAPLRKRSASE